MLTKTQQADQIAAATLSGAQRYTVEVRQAGGYSVRDHENAEWISDADGQEILSERDARDLAQEYIWS